MKGKGQGGLDGFPFWLEASSSETTSDRESVNCQPCYPCLYFKEEEKNQNSVSPHKTPLFNVWCRLNREVKNCWDIEEGSVSADCKGDFMNK